MAIRPTRRAFLQTSAGAAGAILAAREVLLDPEAVEASRTRSGERPRALRHHRRRHAGHRACWRRPSALPGVECAAACDLYDGRHTLAQGDRAARTCAPPAAIRSCSTTRTIDCIVAAVPDHWHRKIVVDAVSAGKDIYCEKPMSHKAADGVAMVAAAKKSGRIVQIGSQRVSSLICAKAKELIAQGALGDLTLVEGWLGRNDPTGAWQYPPPPDLSPRTSTGTPGRATSPSARSTPTFSRAGAAGRSTAPAWRATCSSISSAA